MSQKNFQVGDQAVAVDLKKFNNEILLISPVQAGAALGFARQTTHNLLSKKKFPVPLVKVGKRRMVRVSDLAKFVNELCPEQMPAQQPRRPGRPKKKEEASRREAEKKGVEA